MWGWNPMKEGPGDHVLNCYIFLFSQTSQQAGEEVLAHGICSINGNLLLVILKATMDVKESTSTMAILLLVELKAY